MVLASLIVVWVAIIPAAIVLISLAAARRRWSRASAAIELLERVAAYTAREVVRGGHAVHRRYRWGRTRVNYIRWCDAHVALGLVDAAATLDRLDGGNRAQVPAPESRQETR